MTTLDAVRAYTEAGWAVVPIEYRSKKPSSNDWQTPLPVADVLRIYASAKKNVGILWGQHSGWLVDIDLDCPEAVRLAPSFLPPTEAVFGRYSNPASHYVYKCTSPADTRKYIDRTLPADAKRMIAEFRSTGHQTVVPPSVHEDTGENIEWARPGMPPPPASVAPEDLLRSVARLAAAVVVTRFWPTGARHEASMALAGTLHRCGLTDEQVLSFVDQICVLADDEEKPDRLRAARDTLKRAHGKKKYTGATALTDIMGEEPVALIRSFLTEAASEDDLSTLNEEYKFVMVGGKPSVAWVRNSNVEPRRMIDFLTLNAFRDWLAGRFIIVGKGDAAKPVRLADYWLNTPKVRPTYEEVAFAPGAPPTESVFNLWRGWSADPRPGDCTLFLEHIRENVCSGNEEWNTWVLSFIADLVQKPGRKPGVCLVLRGGEGIGKSVFASVIASLVSEHSYRISNAQHLVGKFNAHLLDCLLLVAEEAFFAGDKAHEGVLKSLITEDRIMVERKGFDAIQTRNCTRVVMTSNEEWVVPASIDARRFAVFDVGTARRNDRAYFSALWAQMEDGGREALLHFLQTYQYDDKILMQPPQNEALIRQKNLSMSPVQRWWLERLQEGDPCPSVETWGKRGDDVWPHMAAKDALYEDFTLGGRDRGRQFSKVRFWIELNKFLGPDERKTSLLTANVPSRNARGQDVVSPTRKLFLELPPLDEARLLYEKQISRRIEWPVISADNVVHLQTAREY